MGTLHYVATVSVDGYAADADGDFQWSAPSDEVFDFHVERMATVAVEVLGRRAYELMTYWETYADPDGTPAEHEFARRWRGIEKVAVSSTLTDSELIGDRVRLVPRLPLEELRDLVADAADEVSIFGPTTAADAIRAGLVDVVELFVVPKLVGGGLRALPEGARLDLRLDDRRVFGNGLVYLRYGRG